MKIFYKPLSVNECWKGRRFKTDAYKQYERDLLFLLPKMVIPESPLMITFIFGFKNMASDIDNPCKPLLDILQKKYGFNDKDVYSLLVLKVQSDKPYFNIEISHFG